MTIHYSVRARLSTSVKPVSQRDGFVVTEHARIRFCERILKAPGIHEADRSYIDKLIVEQLKYSGFLRTTYNEHGKYEVFGRANGRLRFIVKDQSVVVTVFKEPHREHAP